ncbi:MerR family transcriptional regulator [Spongorhabdus nitratireducens]
MLTVTQLARRFSISRATVLYYERAGVLTPSCRSDNGYRWYDEHASSRLEAILAYRSYGVPVSKLSELLDEQDAVTQEQVLRDQFNALEREIQQLRKQQHAIVTLLEQTKSSGETIVTKDRWVEIMSAAGLSEEDMGNWHRQFEKMEPEAHQEFLESLGISEEEIKRIRDNFRN